MSRSVFEVTGSLATDLATIDSNHIGVLVLWPSDGGREGYLRVISTREASLEHAAAIVNDDRRMAVHSYATLERKDRPRSSPTPSSPKRITLCSIVSLFEDPLSFDPTPHTRTWRVAHRRAHARQKF